MMRAGLKSEKAKEAEALRVEKETMEAARKNLGKEHEQEKRHRRGHRSLVGRSGLLMDRSRHRRGHRNPVEWSWSTVVPKQQQEQPAPSPRYYTTSPSPS